MKLAPGTPVSLALDFGAGTAPVQAGRLAMDQGLAQLEWSPEVIARRLPVAPLLYPPEAGLQPARGLAFDGLQGFVADSLPEGWGYLLMRKRLAKLGVDIATLSPLDRLALVGRHGRGALVFEPATTPPEDVASLDLDALAADAAALLSGEDGQLADTLAGLAGASGGARPKVHVGFDDVGHISIGEGELPAGFTPWLVKFRAPNDPVDIGPIEEAYATMAQAAGLTLSAHRLIPAQDGPGYFATRRFDRPEGGRRLHMVSLAGAIEASPHMPSASYDLFLRATLAITRRASDVKAAFQRMLFNVLASNRDDHTRQHAYLMGPDGDWSLAHAYDLTYAAGPGGEHYMDVEGEGRNPTLAQVRKLGARHGFDAKAVDSAIEMVRAAVADWSVHANNAGVTAASAAEIAEAHARVRAAFTAS
ncbi:MAG TPA: type II toxin-antitoxin system HipA family toxin [Caulobacteraceae bacterium]|jgi:serine/threonine-protein kinase HipA|nr:type II toxin-antitoxin system HipA family toxin [Caulobacteraceae bacterium]